MKSDWFGNDEISVFADHVKSSLENCEYLKQDVEPLVSQKIKSRNLSSSKDTNSQDSENS